MQTSESEIINNFLKTLPKVPNCIPDKSMFQLVWSTDARETRIGTFREFCGPLFIREVSGAREVPKYDWMPNRWVLEQWHPPEVAYNPELPLSGYGSYEPLYVFENAKGEPLPLNLKVVQFVISRVFKPKRSEAKIKTDIKDQLQLAEDTADAYVMDVLNDESHLVSLLHSGSGSIVPANFAVESPNLRNKNA